MVSLHPAAWLPAALSCLGAVLCLLTTASMSRMKTWALLTTVAAFLAAMGTIVILPGRPSGLPFLVLLPIAAFLTLLGQPLHPAHRRAWSTTLGLLGIGMGILTLHGPTRGLLLAALFAGLCVLLYRPMLHATPDTWRGVTVYGIGLLAALATLVLPPPAATIAGLTATTALLPLFPLQGGFIAALTGLPGNLPAFLAFLLPVIGFHSLLLLFADFSTTFLETLAILAPAGAAYGALRALIQSRPAFRLAYAGFTSHGLLWWYLAVTGTAPAQATVYLCAAALGSTGLLSAWYCLRARYGEIDLRALGGLAYPMSRFSTLLVLLALAALGMPPFGVYAGFMGLLLNPAFTPSGAFFLIMVIWLSASWYFTEFIQAVVFGRPRVDLPYDDLHRGESAALLLTLLLLLLLGTAPSRLFQPDASTPASTPALGDGR